ncbi:MAG: hypothetical protein GQ565_05905 [Candidatus Aegiribacteria sp.]|nr:hypothetical protein [Candidatus Aegiribacteria sp.]
MYGSILIILLSFLPENLQPWYSSCSQGDWGAAAEKAGDIYAADSTDVDALAAMFIASALENEFEAGTGFSAESFLPDSQTSLTHAARGVLLMSGTDPLPEEAGEQLLESIRQDPENVLALYLLGTLKAESDGSESALHYFDETLSLDPDFLPALLSLGDIAQREARTEDAVDYYLMILEQDVFNSFARNRLRIIAGDSYEVESTIGTMQGFSASTSADLSIERGNRAMLDWGGSARLSYRFDRRGTSVDAAFGGRSVTWEEIYGLSRDSLNTNRGWARLGVDYWFHDSYYVEAASDWDRQMYTERPWQITSYCSVGWQKSILSWFWFSPKLGFGSVNARWTSGAGEMFINDFSVFASADLRYRKLHTFIREAEISGNVYFPPDNPENFISKGSISLALSTWSPLYVRIGYAVDYTRSPEISTWKKFNSSFTTSINFDLF